MPDQRAVTSTWLGKAADTAKVRKSAAPLLPGASGRNQPRGARNWIACPSRTAFARVRQPPRWRVDSWVPYSGTLRSVSDARSVDA